MTELIRGGDVTVEVQLTEPHRGGAVICHSFEASSCRYCINHELVLDAVT